MKTKVKTQLECIEYKLFVFHGWYMFKYTSLIWSLAVTGQHLNNKENDILTVNVYARNISNENIQNLNEISQM